MLDEIKKIRNNFKNDIEKVRDSKDLEALRTAYLGRKGSVAEVFKYLKNISADSRAAFGKEANNLKIEVEKEINKKMELVALQIDNLVGKSLNKKDFFDISAPAQKIPKGSKHPLTLVREEIEKIFLAMGFEVADGPDIETEYYNFDALNIPKNHPARDMWDTFWIDTGKKDKYLLRTHTSPVQIRYAESHEPPIRIIAPGRSFRYEATDARHEIQFHQLEGLMIDRCVSLANLKSVIEVFLAKFFRRKVEIRFLPSYFPFVEPGVEVEAECFFCSGKKRSVRCHICGGAGWFEIMGAGMVHKKVLEKMGISSNQWQGFAFGVGLDRLAMLKYKIDDIRLFYGSDLRFLKQFTK